MEDKTETIVGIEITLNETNCFEYIFKMSVHLMS